MYKGEERRSKDSKRDEFHFWGTRGKELKETRAIKKRESPTWVALRRLKYYIKTMK